MTKQELIKSLDAEIQHCRCNIDALKDADDKVSRDISLIYWGRVYLASHLIYLLHTKPDPTDYRKWDDEQPWSGWVI